MNNIFEQEHSTLEEEGKKLPTISDELGKKLYSLTQKHSFRAVAAALVEKYNMKSTKEQSAISLTSFYLETIIDLHLAKKALREMENW